MSAGEGELALVGLGAVGLDGAAAATEMLKHKESSLNWSNVFSKSLGLDYLERQVTTVRIHTS